jgi:hypothetical protein
MSTLEIDSDVDLSVLAEIEATHLGPVWERNPEWDGLSLTGPRAKFILPAITLGHQVLSWIKDNLLSPDSNEYHHDPFSPTYEQWRFILWWYAIDGRGRWIYRRGVFQRMKGHGKDPLASVISAVELLGPCRFGGWCANPDGLPELGLEPDGTPSVKFADPVGVDNPNAWIQIAAVSKTQTQNTMLLFPALFSDDCKARAYMRADSIGVSKVTAHRGRRQIQAVTSNPSALEGGRPSLVIKNETEHWTEQNRGWDMDAVIDRNAAKSKGGSARSLAICNAPEPSQESVGRRERDAYLAELEGRAFSTGVMYDSLELPEDVPLYPIGIDHFSPEEQEVLIMEHLRRCLTQVRGDSWWLDWERIALEILDTKVGSSSARRFYFNQAIAAEDSWVQPKAVNAAVDPMAGVLRTDIADQTRCTWDLVRPDEPIVMFFDGSKSDDATALVGCRISDGFCFVIGIWQAPPHSRRRGTASWLAPRGEIDSRVDEAFGRFDVIAFWADPSHAKAETESGESEGGYWQGLIDDWHLRHKDKLFEEHWSVKSGLTTHSILWDMSSPLHTKLFVHAAEQTVDELEHTLPDGTLAPKFAIDGHPRLLEHLKNAKKAPGQYGVSMRKEGRESLRKIDGGVAMVGARMLRRMVLNAEVEEEQEGGWAHAV